MNCSHGCVSGCINVFVREIISSAHASRLTMSLLLNALIRTLLTLSMTRHSLLTLLSLGVQIKWENGFMSDNGSHCEIAVDGTDFMMQEPMPFNSEWFSEKFKGPGCWNVQLHLAIPSISFYFISRASVPSHSREPGQSWKPALTGSSFQLIWPFNSPHSGAQQLSHNFY